MTKAQEEYSKKLQLMSNDEPMDEAKETEYPDWHDGIFTELGAFKAMASWNELERRLRLIGFVK